MQNDTNQEKQESKNVEHDADYEVLLESLSYDPTSADELAENSGLTIDQVSSMLLILELDGKIEKLTGGRYALLH
jgi:DNA processing protein